MNARYFVIYGNSTTIQVVLREIKKRHEKSVTQFVIKFRSVKKRLGNFWPFIFGDSGPLMRLKSYDLRESAWQLLKSHVKRLSRR